MCWSNRQLKCSATIISNINSNEILILNAADGFEFASHIHHFSIITINRMNYNNIQTPLSRCILAGLATGIIATVINLIFNFIFRGITRLSLSVSVINVSTIIFATVILCVVAGLVYHFIVFYFKKSSNFFVVLFIFLTVVAILSGFNFHRSDNPVISLQFEGLYAGIVIITGFSGAFIIPWLAKHKNVFFN